MTVEAPFKIDLRVYLEDSDAQGIVYHANYLNYFERARTELFALRGPGMRAALDRGHLFVVHEARLKYLKPGRVGDLITIETRVERTSPYRLAFKQDAFRSPERELLCKAEIDVVCIDKQGNLFEVDAQTLAAVDS